MNKLVTVFSALAVAAGIAQGEVKSANVVGYDTLKSQEGFNWIAPEFLEIGNNTVNIQSIQLSGDGIDPAGGDNIQFLDAGGKTVASYGWLLAADTGADADGWFDEENWELADVSLAPGAGVLVNTVSSDVVITVDSAL